jgi:type II secretory pathway pseudopilin PulG
MDWGAILGAIVTVLSLGLMLWRQVVTRRAKRAAEEAARLRAENEALRAYQEMRGKLDAVAVGDDSDDNLRRWLSDRAKR